MTSYTSHPDYRHLLAAVIAQPADDVRRLVLADWLDEHGQPERAEFIRVQIELVKPVSSLRGTSSPIPLHRFYVMQDRQREIFNRYATTWFGGSWAVLVCGDPEEDSTATFPDLGHAFATRGFIGQWHGPLAAWCGAACGRCARRRRMAAQIERLEGEEAGVDASGLAEDLMAIGPPCPACNGAGRTTGIGPAVVRSHPVERVVLVGAVGRSRVPGSPFGAATRESCGPLFDEAFPKAIGGRIEGNADILDGVISAAAIAWAKSQEVRA